MIPIVKEGHNLIENIGSRDERREGFGEFSPMLGCSQMILMVCDLEGNQIAGVESERPQRIRQYRYLSGRSDASGVSQATGCVPICRMGSSVAVGTTRITSSFFLISTSSTSF